MSKITPHFTLTELTHSATGVRKGLKNIPTAAELENIKHTAEQLEKIRTFVGAPIVVTSCFRSEAVNKAVGGSATSAHRFGLAADISAPKFGNSVALARKLLAMRDAGQLAFDQLILEYPGQPSSWVHIGFVRNGKQRNQVLTAKRLNNGKTQYNKGLLP